MQALAGSPYITPGVLSQFAVSLASPRLEAVLAQCDQDRDALQVLLDLKYVLCQFYGYCIKGVSSEYSLSNFLLKSCVNSAIIYLVIEDIMLVCTLKI